MKERYMSLAYFLIFCFLTGSLAFFFLYLSMKDSEDKVLERITNTSFLIGEWIKGAFKSSDYILRDLVYTIPVSELQFPTLDKEAHARISKSYD